MINIKLVTALSRAATFELENNACYDAPCRFRIWLNGEQYGAYQTNVFSLFGLKPDMQYQLKMETQNGETGELLFITPKETSFLNVLDFGAVPDGVYDCTVALQAAIAACEPEGIVYVPQGVYQTYPLFLKTGVTLYLEKDAVLKGGVEREKYPVLPGMVTAPDGTEINYGTWEGNPLDCFASLLTAIDETDIAVIGEGIVDGNAQNADWWENAKIRNGAWRPRTIFCNRCQRVTLLGITVQNSPSWTVHPYYCTDVQVLDVKIQNPYDTPNTDGCNPESCKNVMILGARISVGDDCIAVKSGKYYMSIAHLCPTENVLIRNCYMERGHGAVVVGSEVSAGVLGLTVDRCLMQNTDRGLRIKTRRGRGEHSILTDIVCTRIRMNHVKTPFVINMFYCCDPDGHSEYVRSKQPYPVNEKTPRIGKLLFRDIVCENCQHAGAYFYGLPEQPIAQITMEDIRIAFHPEAQLGYAAMMDDVEPLEKQGLQAVNIQELMLRNVNFSDFAGEDVQCENVIHYKREP